MGKFNIHLKTNGNLSIFPQTNLPFYVYFFVRRCEIPPPNKTNNWNQSSSKPASGVCLCVQTLTVTPVLTTKTLPLVLKAAATPTLPGSVLPQRPPTVTMVTTAITKPDSQSAPINLQVASKLTNQSPEPVRLVSKNAMVVRRPFSFVAASLNPTPVPPALPTQSN